MKRGNADTRLRKAFGLAVLVHVAALVALAHLPLARASGSSLDQLTVFDPRARLTASPVTLVTLPPPETSPAPLVVVAPPRPKQRTAPEPRPQQAPPHPTPHRAEPPRPAPATLPQPPAPPAAVGPGGGGGGPVNTGSPSPNGTFPAPGGTPGGDAPPGRVPGEGGGSGPGEGPGSDGGAGGGAGGGEGADTGEGHAPAPAESSGHVSTTADQANPKVLRTVEPVYPESAVADGVEGTVVMKVLVSERGEVLKAEVQTSSGDRRLDRAALDSVRRWRYEPAVQGGKPRRVSTPAVVTFKLE